MGSNHSHKHGLVSNTLQVYRHFWQEDCHHLFLINQFKYNDNRVLFNLSGLICLFQLENPQQIMKIGAVVAKLH